MNSFPLRALRGESICYPAKKLNAKAFQIINCTELLAGGGFPACLRVLAGWKASPTDFETTFLKTYSSTEMVKGLFSAL
jgi:hypothetical protein